VRRVFCQVAAKKMGYSGADVAPFLGINIPAVNRLAVSDELLEVEKYIYIVLEPTFPFTGKDYKEVRASKRADS